MRKGGSDSDKMLFLGGLLVIMTVIAVIVGVIWTASTGRSGQRVYLGSALISMLVIYLVGILGFAKDTWPIIILCILLGIGFFFTGIITSSTGNSTDSLPYLISAVVSVALFILVFIVGGGVFGIFEKSE